MTFLHKKNERTEVIKHICFTNPDAYQHIVCLIHTNLAIFGMPDKSINILGEWML